MNNAVELDNIKYGTVYAGNYNPEFYFDMENFFPKTIDADYLFYPIIQRRTIISPSIELFNIEFRIKHDGTDYHIISDQWPILNVFGSSVKEAISELQSIIKDVIQEYVMVPEVTLSPESIEFRNFLLNRIFQ
ncbi:MAG: hypothetical protein ABSA44_10595 [Bacteroidota bacterium]|jgi:hypothetical protein